MTTKTANPFAGMSMTQVADALDTMRKEAQAIFATHTVEGDIQFETITADEGAKLAEINGKLADAQKRYEELSELAGFSDRTKRLEEFLNAPAGTFAQPTKAVRKTWEDAGSAFIKSAAYKGYRGDGAKNVESDVDLAAFHPFYGAMLAKQGYVPPAPQFAAKATLGTDSGLADVDVQYPPEVLRDGRLFTNILAQSPNIADLCVQVQTGENAIKYMKQSTRTHGAVETAEGALLPEASYEWTETTDPIKKIGHIFPVTDELLADEPFLRGIVNTEMRLGVLEREDRQLLRGDGTGQNLTGINNRAGIGNVNWSIGTEITAQSYAEKILTAITTVAKAFRRASAIVTSLTTWQFIRLAKDQNDMYLFAQGIQDAGVPRLWGLPLVPNENQQDYSTATNIGATVGAFATDAYVVRREGVTLSVSDSHSDYFARDTLTLKARERVGLAVVRPAAFVKVTTVA